MSAPGKIPAATAAERLAATYTAHRALWSEGPIFECPAHRASFLSFCAACAQEHGTGLALTAGGLAAKRLVEVDP